ncbi:MAG: hypothetical protein HQL81_04580 [Magnetococcales bacterium]|nr:hypothetical protein [Magnetococcales bacterium]
MKITSPTLIFIYFLTTPLHAASMGVGEMIPPPSPMAAMASSLQRSRDAMVKARLLDEQRKAAWIEARETIRQTRRQSEQFKQVGETAWADPSMSHEELAQALNKAEESSKQADALEQQAQAWQRQQRSRIKKLLTEAEAAENTANIIQQSWIKSHGQQAIEVARNHRQHLQHSTEVQALQLQAARNALEQANLDLQKAVTALEQLKRARQERSEHMDQALKEDQQQWMDEEQRADGFMTSSTLSHEELLDSLERKQTLGEQMAASSRKKSATDTRMQTREEELTAKIAQLRKGVELKTETLKNIQDRSTALIQRLQIQSQRADALARLAAEK